MADPDNQERTVDEALASETNEGVYDAVMRPDIIRTWNDRRLSNNIKLTSLVPFVQLIGIFNKTEYEKLFAMKDVSTRRPVVFTPDSQPQGWSSDRTVADYVVENNPNSTAAGSKSNESDESIWDWIQNELKDRFR